MKKHLMYGIYACLFFLSMQGLAADKKVLPIADGHYIFQHRFAEHPMMESVQLNVLIQGNSIRIENNDAMKDSLFPLGLIDEGELYWHASSGQWIIVTDDSDKEAVDVGGCSDGPYVVDLIEQEYWTC